MIGIEALIGVALPIVIEFLAKYIKGSSGKFIIALVLPLLAGIALNFESLSVIDAEAVLASGAIIFTSAQGIYKLFFRDSKIQKRIVKL